MKAFILMYEPLEVTKCKKCGKVIAEPKELVRTEEKMITSKIKTWHWFLFILLIVALVLSLVALALSIGEQYHVVAEEFQSIFQLSMLISVISLIIGIMYFERWRRRWQKLKFFQPAKQFTRKD